MHTFLQEIRLGLRQMRRAPVFTAVAILTLALGIGANTAVFTLLDQALLRTLPVSHADRDCLPFTTGNQRRTRFLLCAESAGTGRDDLLASNSGGAGAVLADIGYHSNAGRSFGHTLLSSASALRSHRDRENRLAAFRSVVGTARMDRLPARDARAPIFLVNSESKFPTSAALCTARRLASYFPAQNSLFSRSGGRAAKGKPAGVSGELEGMGIGGQSG